MKFPELPTYDHIVEQMEKETNGKTLRASLMNEIIKIESKILEDKIIKHLPIYTTKGRVKDDYSMYLKLKRKQRDIIWQCTDFAGIRVIVMFEEELFVVLNYLLEDIIPPGNLCEMKIFNMMGIREQIEKSDFFKKHRDKGFNYFEKRNYEYIDRIDGYRSIHLLFTVKINKTGNLFDQGEDCFIFELQLRTLLDDLWAEMEHNLSYKQGKSHPQILNSFMHLKSDLLTMGGRLSHLRSLRLCHIAVDRLAIRESGPYPLLKYEDQWNPLELNIDNGQNPFASPIQKYAEISKKFTSTEVSHSSKKEYICESKKIFKEVDVLMKSCSLRDYMGEQDEIKIKYYIKMERGYAEFLDGKYENAITMYKEIKSDKKYEARSVPSFRLGEVLFARNNDDNDIKLSLKEFDNAIVIMKKFWESGHLYSDIYRCVCARILNKIAAVYEILGSDEYLDNCIALSELGYNMVKDSDSINLIHVRNNLGWYYTEKLRVCTAEGKDNVVATKLKWHKKASEMLKPVISYIDKHADKNIWDLNRNILDTAAVNSRP